MMSVKIWHNPDYREIQGQLQSNEPIEISLKSLQLVAIANAADLNTAWMLAQTTDQQQGHHLLKIIQPGRQTTNGDVLETEENHYYLIAIDHFMPLIPKSESEYLTPVICKELELEGLLERNQVFTEEGFIWKVVRVLEYDLQATKSTVVACQGPPIDAA